MRVTFPTDRLVYIDGEESGDILFPPGTPAERMVQILREQLGS